jgi:hypothetical protein
VASSVDRDLTVANLRTRELYIQHAKVAENATQRARSNINQWVQTRELGDVKLTRDGESVVFMYGK